MANILLEVILLLVDAYNAHGRDHTRGGYIHRFDSVQLMDKCIIHNHSREVKGVNKFSIINMVQSVM